MGASFRRPLPPLPVEKLHHDDDASATEVKNLSRLDVPLSMAKAKVGAAVTAAIGDNPLKAFGHEGLVSGVASGERVPDYLARIYQDKPARRRLALALLEDDTDVIVTTTVSIPMSKR